MTIRTVITFPHPNLRIKAEPVQNVTSELSSLIDDMFETMYDDNGIGLAATQIDVHQRILVIDMRDGKQGPIALINPEIVEKEGEASSEEGCLSVPGYFADVKRSERVTVKALDKKGKEITIKADGRFAICLQHEIDHLNGVLFVDYLSPLKQQTVRRKMEKLARQKSR